MLTHVDSQAPVSHGVAVDDAERQRERQIGDIADWYRGQIDYGELRRAGYGASVLADYPHRLILASSYRKDVPWYAEMLPPEAHMEYDGAVLALLRQGLQHTDQVVVVDTSDIPGPWHGADGARRAYTARVSVFDLRSGEAIGEPQTIIKPAAELPQALRQRLLSVPKQPGRYEQQNLIAHRFFHDFVRSCTDPRSVSGVR